MVNYGNGKIYKIVNDINGMTYYGSTSSKLCKRMSCHRADYKIKHTKTYEKFGNIEDCKIYLVEEYPCENKEQLHSRERFYIENNECVNKTIPCRTIKEWEEDNKERIIETKKKWREKNKEKIYQQKKIYYQENKERIKIVRKKYLERKKKD